MPDDCGDGHLWPGSASRRAGLVVAWWLGLVGLIGGVAQRDVRFFAGGLMFVGFGAFGAPRRGRPVAVDGGVLLPLSRWRVAMVGVSAAGMALGVAFWPGGPLHRLACVAIAVAILVAVAAALPRMLRGGLLLTPNWLRVNAQRRRRWPAHVTPVVSGAGGQSGLLIGKALVRLDLLAVDPGTAFRVLHFYATHPEARGELADGAALARIAAGDLG